MGRRVCFTVSGMALTATLAGCLWGASSIGGTLSGLPSGTSVTLQNNGIDNLTLTINGAFEFARTIDLDESYAVTVLTDPTGATCSVANGSGTISSNGRDVTNVAVTCAANASITGTVTGLAAGTALTLLNNGVSPLVVGLNGAFAFPGGILSDGTAYAVTVSVNPAGYTCTVGNGTGTVAASTPTNITVTCSPV